jgi:hypothetical protein
MLVDAEIAFLFVRSMTAHTMGFHEWGEDLLKASRVGSQRRRLGGESHAELAGRQKHRSEDTRSA